MTTPTPTDNQGCLWFVTFWKVQGGRPLRAATLEEAKAFAQAHRLEFEEEDSEAGAHLMELEPEWESELRKNGDFEVEALGLRLYVELGDVPQDNGFEDSEPYTTLQQALTDLERSFLPPEAVVAAFTLAAAAWAELEADNAAGNVKTADELAYQGLFERCRKVLLERLK